jgi:hypothetical protein
VFDFKPVTDVLWSQVGNCLYLLAKMRMAGNDFICR